MKPFSFLAVLAFAVLLVAGCGAASAPGGPQITVVDPYARAAIPNGAAFMELKNSGSADDALIAAESDVAKAVELHESKMTDDGMMQMKPVEKIVIPAGESAVLQPGGLHVMLIGLQRELKKGDSFTLTLRFEKSPPQTVNVTVRESMGAE